MILANQSKILDLSQAAVVLPVEASRREKTAARMLVEEIEKRTQIRLAVLESLPGDGRPAILLSRYDALPQPVKDEFDMFDHVFGEEGYAVEVIRLAGVPVTAVVGTDERGVLFGAGCLLRNLQMTRQRLALAENFHANSAPRLKLRGHQLGYRDKTNSYDGWDLCQWEQYIRDLAVFGTNAIELIPPRSDDRLDSVHFPLPPMETMVGMSQIADDYGLDVWIWFPALDPDYTDPAWVEFALKEWGEVFRRLPRIDAVFVPGGDPGKAPPQVLMPMLEKQQRQLRALHPKAQIWISPQGFTGEWMTQFLKILREESPTWLDGVVHGPWIHIPIPEFRQMIPPQYALRNYPDITHSLNCQFPVPGWDIAYALTEGRETINPRPLDEEMIFHATARETIGFLTYSEGCNDDVNKFVWSGLGWNPDQPVMAILREYSRYFIGEAYTDSFAQGLLALERNWRGPLLSNSDVSITLQQFQALERSAAPQVLQNWRFQQALYRAYYDAYVRARLIYETNLEEQALDLLRGASRTGSRFAIEQALQVLDQAQRQPVAQGLRTRIFQLAEALFQSIHMQLSVHLYQGQEEVRGANLDGVDYPLTDAPWLRERMEEISALPDEASRLQALEGILHWRDPGPGGYYADLGAGVPSPYVVGGLSYADDPAFLKSPARKYPYRKNPQTMRLAWRGFTGSLNDQPFQMRFPNLDPLGKYRLRIVYSEQQSHHAPVKVRLDAGDGIEIHPYMARPAPRKPVEFDLPAEATRRGELTLTWRREPGLGGIGLGCDISEIWLVKLA
ncbi:MAG TPA: alpha-glucuronidase family glycosyl hydrolase [Anaerolineaceae bacterium]